MISSVLENPVIPQWWGAAQKGMQADAEISDSDKIPAENEWLAARDSAVAHTRQLLELGLHKQIPNRLLEPFMWMTSIVSSTEWSNFFELRTHSSAEPHFRTLACTMLEAMSNHEPVVGIVHLPLVETADLEELQEFHQRPEEGLEPLELNAMLVSAARCARVSYVKHDVPRSLPVEIAFGKRLLKDKHLSPLEHPARIGVGRGTYFNYENWKSLRYILTSEDA